MKKPNGFSSTARKIISIIFLIVLNNGLFAQEVQNPRKDNPFGINLYGGSPTLAVSVSLDYFITPNINIETGIGLLGYYAGAKYHIGGQVENRNWTPYVGAFYSVIVDLGILGGGDDSPGIYIPFGINYLGNKGFNFSIELAARAHKEVGTFSDFVYIPIWGGIKIGYHF